MIEIVLNNKPENKNIECQAYGVCKSNSLTQTLQHCSYFGLKVLDKNKIPK